jgi:hypothetical protein
MSEQNENLDKITAEFAETIVNAIADNAYIWDRLKASVTDALHEVRVVVSIEQVDDAPILVAVHQGEPILVSISQEPGLAEEQQLLRPGEEQQLLRPGEEQQLLRPGEEQQLLRPGEGQQMKQIPVQPEPQADPQPREDALLEIEEVWTAANRRGVHSVASKLEEWARSVDATTPETFKQDEHRERMKLMREELKQSAYVPREDVQ